MSDQQAMQMAMASQGTDAMGPATFSLANQPQIANQQPVPTGMSMPTNPQGWSGQQGVAGGSWYDNLFKPMSPDAQKAFKQLGALGVGGLQQNNAPKGALAQPMMGGGHYQPHQMAMPSPVLMQIRPSRIL
jgi:hypothetical protein